MKSPFQPPQPRSWGRLAAMFAVGLVALVIGIVSSPLDEPALFLLMMAVSGFFLFSTYVFAQLPFVAFVAFPRSCPACHRRTLLCQFFDLSKPLGGVRRCRRCGVITIGNGAGPGSPCPTSAGRRSLGRRTIRSRTRSLEP
jgi:hypothetical protein